MLQTFEGVVQRGHVRLPAGTPLRDGARVIVTVYHLNNSRDQTSEVLARCFNKRKVCYTFSCRASSLYGRASRRPGWLHIAGLSLSMVSA